MSIRCYTGSAPWASKYPGFGATGAVILGTTGVGSSGPGLLYPGTTVADNDKELSFRIITAPAAGSFVYAENGTFTLTGAPNGLYSITFEKFDDQVSVGQATSLVAVGVVVIALAAANCTQPNTCTGGAVTFTAPGITLAAANCTQVNTCTTGAVTILTPGVLPTVISAARTYSVPKDTTANTPGQGIRLPLVWLIDLDANLDFACDWAAWLADGGDTLASVYVSADPLQLLVTISGVVQTTKSAAMIRPQQLGTWPLNFRMTTMQGRVDERTVLLEVVQR